MLPDLEVALGRLVRGAEPGDALRDLQLDVRERAYLDALAGDAGFAFTVAVQRSWCMNRAAKAADLTLSVLDAPTRRSLLERWARSGGGTASFVAAEADALFDFIAAHLDDPSRELTVCRLEQLTFRANEGATMFTPPPERPSPHSPSGAVRRGRHAGMLAISAQVDDLLGVLAKRRSSPPDACDDMVLLFAPGIDGVCRPASHGEHRLWSRLASPASVRTLVAEGHGTAALDAMLRCGAVEYVPLIR